MSMTKKIKPKVKRYCGCPHKDPDYWCACWFDGYQTGQAEEKVSKK